MKAIENLITDNRTFTVLVQTNDNLMDETKGFVSYFINGDEIGDFDKILPRYQRLFNLMADNLCEGLAVIKYSY